MTRETCYDCVRKHIGQAHALLDETIQDYERHFWYAVGHLAEAESESIRENREVACAIRNFRLDLMNHSIQYIEGTYQGPSTDDLLDRVNELIGDKIYRRHHPRNSKQFTNDLAEELLSGIKIPAEV